MNIGLCRIFPGEAMAEDSSNIYQNPTIKTKHPPLSGNPFFFHPRSRFSWNFNYWTSFEIDMFTPVAEKTWYAFEQFWPLLSTSECINGPPTNIARYKGSPPLHAVPPSSLGTGKKVLEPSVRLDETSEKTLSWIA